MRSPVNKIEYRENEKIGECTFLKDVESSKKWKRHAIFICKCGKSFEANITKVKSGHTKSCGCRLIEYLTIEKAIHGKCRKGNRSSEYQIWAGMIQRCHNKKNTSYARYGAKGIFVCHEWLHSFESFYLDMGDRPSPKHSLERTKNNEGYSKENCVWATAKEQSNNRKSNIIIEYKGEYKSLMQWCEELNLEYFKTIQRIKKLKWSPEEAFENTRIKKTWQKTT